MTLQQKLLKSEKKEALRYNRIRKTYDLDNIAIAAAIIMGCLGIGLALIGCIAIGIKTF